MIPSERKAGASSDIAVLLVIGQLQIGGTERHLEAIAAELNRSPLDVSVFVFRAGGPLAASLRARGVRVVEGPARGGLLGTLGAMYALLRIYWDRRPAIVHFFLPQAYLLGGLLSFAAPPMRRLMSRRSLNRYQRKYPGIRWVEKFLHRHMDLVLANAQAVRVELEAEGVDARRIRVIHNGVAMPSALAQRRRDVRAEFAIADGALVLVMVANLIDYKGHLDLLEALSICRADLPEGWRALLVGGEGAAGPRVRTRLRELDLASQVWLVGPRTDVGAILQAADVGLSCSHEEGFSNAILEMMTAGLAIVATDAGGTREAVVDGQTGLLVAPHAPVDFAQALRRVATDPPLRRRLGAAARQRAQESYGLDRCVDRYRAIYLALAGAAMIPGDS